MSRLTQHRMAVLSGLNQLSKGAVSINDRALSFHQYFCAINKKRVIVVVPFPEHSNYAVNAVDKATIEENLDTDQVWILFGKFIHGKLTPQHLVEWNKIDFGERKEGEIGDFYLIFESALHKIKHAETLPLFDGLRDPKDEFAGLFE